MTDLKCLILDIETAPMLAYVWGLKDQNISLIQVQKDWNLIAWGAKWLHAPATEMMYQDLSKAKDMSNDKSILGSLWELLDEADIVITQNGKNFDVPRINARFIMHGMTPPSPFKHLDTYQIAKHTAQFTSNKLEYLTDKLCTRYKKLSHKRFPGWQLWIECLKGNKEAWAEMRTYNIHDVLSTEELFLKLKAWTPANSPKIYNVFQGKAACRMCGAKTHSRGQVKDKKTMWRVVCTSPLCGKWDTVTIKEEGSKVA